MSVLRTVVKGCGGYLPERVLTNEDLANVVDTTDDWIATRTGIKERRIAGKGEFTSTMGTAAARAAIEDAGLKPEDIDLIILATSTPDQTFPATAVTIQADLGITHGAAFDVQAVCSGFVFALTTADNYLKSGAFKRALVIGSEVFSRILDWDDRGTCVLFGDGAGALVVEAEMQNGSTKDRGVLATCLRSDGRYRDKLYVDGGPSTTGTVGYVRMDGPEVFRHAVTNIAEVIDHLKVKGTAMVASLAASRSSIENPTCHCSSGRSAGQMNGHRPRMIATSEPPSSTDTSRFNASLDRGWESILAGPE